MAHVVPKYGKEKEVARLLLDLADDPRDVQVNTDDGFHFVVSDKLHELYLAAIADPEDLPTSKDQAKRRPGRPRKAVVSEPDDTEDGDE